jgi:uncharacterized protein YpbB
MPKITQKTLANILKKRKQIADATELLKELESLLTEQLKAGADVQAGLLVARIKEYERRNIAWKQVLIREKGEEFAARVFNATKPDKYETLVVEIV